MVGKSDQEYEQKSSQVPVRMSQELKDKIPTPRSSWIRKLIIEKLESDSRNTDVDIRNISRNTEFKKYLIFLLKFFQKNASNLEISDFEKEEVKKIIEVLKSE